MGRGAAAGALLLNYTNPVQIVTQALTRYSDVDVIGLCDQHGGEIRFLSGVVGCDPRAMEIDTWGTNHLTLTRAVRIDGSDATDQVFARLAGLDRARSIPTGGRSCVSSPCSDGAEPVPPVLLPAPRVPRRPACRRHDARPGDHRRAAADHRELPGGGESDPPRPMEGRFSDEHGDLAIGVIAAADSGEPTRFVLNVPNQGAIPGLPDDAVVEVPCTLRGREVERMPMGRLPDMIAGLAAQLAVHARLGAQAAVEGDRRVALQAMMSHPLVTSLPAGQAMLDELLAAHAAELRRIR